MIRVLHYYPQSDSMVSQYVAMLSEHTGLECSNEQATEMADALQRLRSSHYDILHLHGCWRNSSYRVVRQALRQGTRLVLSPHGHLEPWVISENYWNEKLPKRLLYQKRIVQQAYAVVIQGKMEQDSMRQLGWNPRTLIIRNALITQTTTPRDMASQHAQLYRKVLDSNPLALMDDDLRSLLRQVIKVGITGDQRWLTESLQGQPDTAEKWRLLLCYAKQEQISNTIGRGLSVLRYEAPDVDAGQIEHFMPEGYQTPQSIESVIGNSFATENDRLLATFRHLRKLVSRRQLAIMHLIELDKELRHHGCMEAELADTLEEQSLYKLARRLMGVMHELTGFTEGFMPVPPLYDRTMRAMTSQVINHLKI